MPSIPPSTEHPILLRQLRAIGDLQRKQVARLLGIDPRTLWDYEHGRAEPPPELYDKLCQHVGLSWAAFAGCLRPAARVIARDLAGNTEANRWGDDDPGFAEIAAIDAKEMAALEGLLADFAAADAAGDEATEPGGR